MELQQVCVVCDEAIAGGDDAVNLPRYVPAHSRCVDGAGDSSEPCGEYRDALRRLLLAIDDIAGERGIHWTKGAHDAVENARSLLSE